MKDTDKQKSKSLLSGTIIYAIGNFGTKILSFIIVPLYTYYINTSDMGDYDLINTTVSLLTPIITLQIMDAAYAWMIRDQENSPSYITAIYKFMAFSSILAVIIILIVNAIIPITYCYYFIGVLITSRIFNSLQKLLRGLNNQKLFAASGIIYTAIFLCLNLLQIVVLKQGVVALFQSSIISYTICIAIVLIAEKRLRVLKLKEKSIPLQKEMLKFSVPLIPNQLNWWIMNSLDRYIILYFLGKSANGIFSISHKFPSLLLLVFNTFYMSWQDTAITDKEKNSGEFYTKIFRMYYRLSFSLLLFLIPLTKIFILFFMSDDYQTSSNYVSFLYMGTVFQAFSSFFGVGYLKNNKTKQAATTSIYGAVINAVIDIALMKFIGLYAAAISTFIGFFVMFIIRVFQTRETMKIKIRPLEFSILFFASILVCIVSVFTDLKYDIIISVIGGLIFLIINKNEVLKIANSFIKKLKKKR